jgi:hypothetical protein
MTIFAKRTSSLDSQAQATKGRLNKKKSKEAIEDFLAVDEFQPQRCSAA